MCGVSVAIGVMSIFAAKSLAVLEAQSATQVDMHFCCTAVILTALHCEDMQALVAGSNWSSTRTNVGTHYHVHGAVQQPDTAHNR
jgi:hypothetical protein